MCRYYYRDGLCANNSIDEAECVGLEQCDESFAAFGAGSEKSCGYDKWYGLYCNKYKRFFCAGMGNCENFEDYMENFTAHMSDAKGQGFHNEMQV